MPKIFSSTQQYRQTNGQHINWQDKKQGGQQQQDRRILHMAKYPGLHTENRKNSNPVRTAMQLLLILHSIRHEHVVPAITQKRAADFANQNHLQNADFYWQNRQVIRDKGTQQDNHYASEQSKTISATKLTHSANTVQNKQNIITLLANASLITVNKQLENRGEHSIKPGVVAAIPNRDIQLFPSAVDVPLQAHSSFSSTKQVLQKSGDHNEHNLIRYPREVILSPENKTVNVNNETNINVDHLPSEQLIALASIQDPDDVYYEQNRLLDHLLSKHNFTSNTHQPFSRVNNLISFLSGEDRAKRTRIVARNLLKPLQEYGSSRGEPISHEHQMAIIARYLNRAIFSMPFNQMLVNQITDIKSQDNSSFHQDYLQQRLTDFITDVLSDEARHYYQNDVLNKILPTLSLPLSSEQSHELSTMEVTHPRWGFIHAGVKLLTDAGIDFSSLVLEEIEELGMMLDLLLRQQAVPQVYAKYFELPALFHDASTRKEHVRLEEINEQELQECYFNYTKQWMENENPFIQFSVLMGGWKTRSELAKEILARHGYSEDYVTNYLNKRNGVLRKARHAHYFIGSLDQYILPLPNINRVFDEQNQRVADTYFEVEKIMLLYVFTLLHKEEQQFIEQAEINQIRIEFYRQLDTPQFHPMASVLSHIYNFVYSTPESICLLKGILNGEERIYVLTFAPDTQKYRLRRVDHKDEQALFLLPEDRSVRSYSKDYRMYIFSHAELKQKEEPLQVLIEKIAQMNSNKLSEELYNRGYDKTTFEKITDFSLSMIPFYSCIKESLAGNTLEAVFACSIDVASVFPLVGQAMSISSRFGSALTKSSITALRYGAKQAAMSSMLKQSAKQFANQFPVIAQEISPQVIRRLGNQLLLDVVDPGFVPLAAGGKKGIQALTYCFSMIKEKSPAVTRLLHQLHSKYFSQLPVVPANIQTKTLFSPENGEKLEVGFIGIRDGQQIWGQFNRETGEFFGRKYTVASSGRKTAKTVDNIPLSCINNSKKPTRVRRANDDAIALLVRSDKYSRESAIYLLSQFDFPNHCADEFANYIVINDRIPDWADKLRKSLTPEGFITKIYSVDVKINTYGDTTSETLLFPENEGILLNHARFNKGEYTKQVATLSFDEKAALKKWTAIGDASGKRYSDGTRDLHNEAIHETLNNALAHGQRLTPELEKTYKDMLTGIDKLSPLPGDFLRTAYYKPGVLNPWLSREIKEGDYVSGSPTFISFSADTTWAKDMLEANNIEENPCAFVIYKVRNANQAKPLFARELAISKMEKELIYVPNSVFRVKGISISQPFQQEAYYEAYKRIGVILEEVNLQDAKQISSAKNLFSGKIVDLPSFVPATKAKIDDSQIAGPSGITKKKQSEPIAADTPAKKAKQSQSAEAVAGPSKALTTPQLIHTIRTLQGIPINIRTYGDVNSKALLYPEIEEVLLRQNNMDNDLYKQAVDNLSKKEKRAMRDWVINLKGGASEINSQLSTGMLSPDIKKSYNRMLSGLSKLPAFNGDYLREAHYQYNTFNPWSSGKIDVDDYVTNVPFFMSVSAETQYAKKIITADGNEDIETFILYKIENAYQAKPVFSRTFSPFDDEKEFLYVPDTLFKVKGISIAEPDIQVAISVETSIKKYKRVGVILEEVNPQQAKQITSAKNLFSGKHISFKR